MAEVSAAEPAVDVVLPGRLDALGPFWIALRRVGTYALVVGPVLILGDMTFLALRMHSLAVDAANSYVPAARSLVDGSSPYRPADIARGYAFTSPPSAGFLFWPFTLVPQTAAEVAMAFLMLGATFLALRLVGLTDWRCYGIAALQHRWWESSRPRTSRPPWLCVPRSCGDTEIARGRRALLEASRLP